MHFGANNQHYPYYINGVSLQETGEERDIGMGVSSSVKPAAQCLKAEQAAGAVLGQPSRSFHYHDRYNFVGLYNRYRYVLPHLEFAVQAWSPWLAKDIEVLEKV